MSGYVIRNQALGLTEGRLKLLASNLQPLTQTQYEHIVLYNKFPKPKTNLPVRYPSILFHLTHKLSYNTITYKILRNDGTKIRSSIE